MKEFKKKCPCCNSKKLRILYENLYDKDFSVEGKFSMLKCENCELEFINPPLNEKQLKKYYPINDYYSYNKRSKLALIYHNISASYYSGKNFFINLFIWPFSSILYTYYIDKDIDKGKTLLEIGCGNGLQLEIYKKYGLKTRGIEPYGQAITEREKEIGIERNSVLNARFPKESFDYIVMKEVLEHIPNQNKVLEICHSWLKKGGKLVIVVPNGESLWQKIFKENWYGYDVPRHLFTYNPQSIKAMLEKKGFKINKIRKYDLPYMIDGSLKFWLMDKNPDMGKIIFSSFSKIFLTPVSLIVTYLNKGSIIEVESERLK